MSRIESWLDTKVETNKEINKVLTLEGTRTFDLYRNTSNNGFTTDGKLELVASVNGMIVEKDKKLQIIIGFSDIRTRDVLQDDQKYLVYEVVKSESTNKTVAKVVKI